MNNRFEFMVQRKPLINPGVFCCTAGGRLRVKVVSHTPETLEMSIGSNDSAIFRVDKESAATLTDFFALVHDSLETDNEKLPTQGWDSLPA